METLINTFLDVYLDKNENLVLFCAGECVNEALFLQELQQISFLPKHVYIIDVLYKNPQFLTKALNNIKPFLQEGSYTFLNNIVELKVDCKYLVAINYQLAMVLGDPSLEKQQECLNNITHKIYHRMY